MGGWRPLGHNGRDVNAGTGSGPRRSTGGHNRTEGAVYGTIYHATCEHLIHYTSSKDSLKRVYSRAFYS